jgi:hypothetical protein
VLRPNGPYERILLMGEWSTGKSRAWLKVAEWIKKTNAPSQIFACDTDTAWERMGWGLDWPHVHVRDCENYDQIKGAVEEARKKANSQRNDWLVVDMADKMWDYAQAGFSTKAFGVDITSWLLEVRAKGENPGGDYGINWNTINRLYADVMNNIIRFPGHVLLVTPAEQVMQPNRDGKGGDDPNVRAMFGKLGVKPRGQKALPFQVHTVILCQDKSQGAGIGPWCMSTAKDRDVGVTPREKMVGAPYNDFVLDYLIKRGGWKP